MNLQGQWGRVKKVSVKRPKSGPQDSCLQDPIHEDKIIQAALLCDDLWHAEKLCEVLLMKNSRARHRLEGRGMGKNTEKHQLYSATEEHVKEYLHGGKGRRLSEGNPLRNMSRAFRVTQHMQKVLKEKFK